MKNPFWVLRSAANPAWLVRAKSRSLLLFYDVERLSSREGPTFAFVMTKGGIRLVGRGGSVEGVWLARPWIVVTFAGARGWPFDVPWLVYMQRKPLRVILSQEGLKLEFEGEDTGYVALMPLYGYLKLPQRGYESSETFGFKARNVRTWEWVEKRILPADVIERVEFWCRTFLRYPVGLWETFYLDLSRDEVVIVDEYEWLAFDDDWETQPLRFAAISPTLALAWMYGFPVEFSGEPYDPDYYTPYGPLVGLLGVDRVEMRFKVLQYINEVEVAKPPDQNDILAQRALERLRKVMRERFPRPDEFDIDHGGGIWVRNPRETNYCWAVMGDQWYAKALPYLDEDLRQVVASSLRKYFRDFVLTYKPYDPHKGKLLLHGPGIGSWGEWGDAGKFSTNLLQTIWAYAYYTGDWELIHEHWELIKRFFVLPDEVRWQGWGRYAIAELGDMAPNCVAMARLAWMVEDLEFYAFAAYCFAKELALHYVMSLGAQYFYENRPHDRLEQMERPVFLTNIWGKTAGWQIDGPRYPKVTGERQYENRWVRFQDADTARFYKEVKPLCRAVEEELSDSNLLKLFRGRECVDDSHILPSLVRLRSLLLDEPPNELAQVCAPERITGPPSGIVASMIAFIRTSAEREYVRLIPRVELVLGPFSGIDRAGGWRYGVADPPYDPDLVMTLREPWATPTWRFWGDAGRPEDPDLYFGMITPDPSMYEGFCRDIPLSWVSNVRIFEPVRLRTSTQIGWGGDWLVLGPLPNRMDESLVADAYPPELTLNSSYVVEGLSYQWRRVRGTEVDLSNLLGTDSGIAYLLTFVRSPKDQRAYLIISNTGGVRVWVNDRLAFSWHERHGSFEFRVVVDLREGWNKILVKLEGAWGKWQAECRLAFGDLRPLEGIEWDSTWGFRETGRQLLLFRRLSIEPARVQWGDTVRVTIEAENVGGSPVAEEIEVKLDGQPVKRLTFSLQPGESGRIEFEISTSGLTIGAHEIEVSGLRERFEIFDKKIAFSILVVVVLATALVTALLLMHRKLRRSSLSGGVRS